MTLIAFGPFLCFLQDGLVAVQSARWGEFLGIMEGCDHWDLRGGGAPRFASKVNPATGKPYAESQQPKPKEKPTSEKSGWGWADVNRLLGNWGSSKSKSKDSRRSTPEPNTPALVASSSPHELPSNASTTLQGNFSTSTSTQTTTQSNLRAGARATETDQSDASALAFLDHYAQLTAADGADGVDLNRVRDRRAEEARPSGDRASVQEAGRSDAALYAGSKGKEEASGAAVFAKDIASWISDRLPQRDDERRLQAEAQADEQDRHDRELRISLAGLQSLDPDAPVMSPQDVSDDARRQIADTYYEGSDIAAEHGQPAAPEDEQSSSEGLLTYGSLPTWEDLATPEAAAMAATDAELGDSAGILPSSPAVSENSPKRADQPESPQSKLRRDAEWQRVLRERIGGDVADRELRREMAWHRAHHLGSTSATRPNPLGSSTFTSFAFTSASEEAATRHFRRPSLPGEREFDWDAHARKRPRSQWESRAQREKETDVSDLERFWVALCRHLWLEGY